MGTGRVEMRDKTGSGFSRTRLERSDVREVTITRRATDSGIKFTVRIVSNIGDHVAGILYDEEEPLPPDGPEEGVWMSKRLF